MFGLLNNPPGLCSDPAECSAFYSATTESGNTLSETKLLPLR